MSRKLFVLTTALLALMQVGPALADGSIKPQSEFEVGLEEFYHKYEEPGVMEEEGWFTGIYGEGIFRMSEDPSSTGVVKLQGNFAYGQVDYTSNNTGDLDNVDDFILELRPLIGWERALSDTMTMTPYLGFGYRFWYDDLRGTSTTGASGYQRKSNYYYLPVGVEFAQNFQSWGWKAVLEGDYLIEGRQITELSDVHPALDDLENTQDEGYGARASVEFTKFGDSIDWSFGPFVRYWDLEDSNFKNITAQGTPIGSLGYEPANETFEAGVRLGLKF